ncbi:uncharacterized protein B0H18DRAFT_1124950 [Fomitopsis serialis]|uniref:uncharacterized protein n=1 Tax=Fomitopsis serialis TaxID=139415 RepID=UPI002007F26D|nr:uncharacterized protein B0H18DRAFT_1124950 [Neoantrodia serialis]KAH9915361.1 hypothetical protein B0H18DRAFT_1124950 [Neoantrodia serialis]
MQTRVPLRREEYPSIKYWHRADWDSQRAQKQISTRPSGRAIDKDEDDNLKNWLFVEDEDGTFIGRDRIKKITSFVCSFFETMFQTDTAPATWDRFEQLRLCAANWKSDYFPIKLYPSWFRKRKLKEEQAQIIPPSDDAHPTDTTTLEIPESGSSGRQANTVSADADSVGTAAHDATVIQSGPDQSSYTDHADVAAHSEQAEAVCTAEESTGLHSKSRVYMPGTAVNAKNIYGSQWKLAEGNTNLFKMTDDFKKHFDSLLNEAKKPYEQEAQNLRASGKKSLDVPDFKSIMNAAKPEKPMKSAKSAKPPKAKRNANVPVLKLSSIAMTPYVMDYAARVLTMLPMCSMKCNFIEVDWIWPVGLAKPREYLEAEWKVVRMPDPMGLVAVRPRPGQPGCQVQRAGEGKEVHWEKLIKLGLDMENPIVVV